MRFILFATSLIGFASAKLKPALRHKKDVMQDPVEDCEQTFKALDQDNSGSLSLGDVEVVSQNLSQVKKAELTDALSQILYATGITNIQDDFSLSHADYMYFCMNADDMEAAISKRTELKKKAAKEKRAAMTKHFEKRDELKELAAKEKQAAIKKHVSVANNNNNNNLQASCYAECGPGQYCGSGGCRPNGSCGVVDDCFISDNVYPVPYILCEGSVYCTSGMCNFQCDDSVSNNPTPYVQQKEKNQSNKQTYNKLQVDPTCHAYFQSMDTDNDGVLTYTEFTAFLNVNGISGADYDDMVQNFGSADTTYTESEFC